MTENYDLKKSSIGIGKLVPILKDKHGNTIDGLHRQELDANWPTITLEKIDTKDKLELARLAVNFCRRSMDEEEKRRSIGYLIGIGLKPQEIAEQTGISERTIYRHMPETLKGSVAEKISEAKKVKSDVVRKEVTAVTSHITTQDTSKPPTPPLAEHPVQCTGPQCSVGSWWPTYLKDGRVLCPKCLAELWTKREITLDDITDRPAVKPPEKPQSKAEVAEYKPKETGEFKRAQMHPGVSKMELAVLEELHKRGHKVEFQKEVCLEKTVVDFIVDGKAVYLDGKRVHRNREWADARIRERLAKILGDTVYAIPYDRFTKSAINEIVTEIEGQ